ncbi:unnamed protein product [marine sediment metagenome]|uniref:Type I restriction enzyme R protein N-terminal domain-containing protein n=1 Tax=marine sediment metagenome TaxID=412755 RepID=X1J2C1_9ZZZZ
MELQDIEKKLKNSIKCLFVNQEDLFKYTTESGFTEWNLAHHLASEIHKEFPRHQLDVELVKHSFKNKRPDIVLHKRGTNSNNFLIIEIKRNKPSQKDLEKIRKNWFKPPLSYRFGASIMISDKGDFEIKVVKNLDNT